VCARLSACLASPRTHCVCSHRCHTHHLHTSVLNRSLYQCHPHQHKHSAKPLSLQFSHTPSHTQTHARVCAQACIVSLGPMANELERPVAVVAFLTAIAFLMGYLDSRDAPLGKTSTANRFFFVPVLCDCATEPLTCLSGCCRVVRAAAEAHGLSVSILLHACLSPL
jgi:hypothetical protein